MTEPRFYVSDPFMLDDEGKGAGQTLVCYVRDRAYCHRNVRRFSTARSHRDMRTARRNLSALAQAYADGLNDMDAWCEPYLAPLPSLEAIA